MEGLTKTTNPSLGRDLNPEYPEYDTGRLQFTEWVLRTISDPVGKINLPVAKQLVFGAPVTKPALM